MDAKSVFLSKTLWFNGLALVVLIASAFGFAEFRPDPELANYALIIITVVNFALRLVTKRSVRV